MLAQVLAMALRLSICVCHKSVFYRNGRTNRAGFRHGSFFPPILQHDRLTAFDPGQPG